MENSPSHSNNSENNHSYNDDSNYGRHDEMGLLRAKYQQSNNKVYHDFFKTKVCSLYSLNICKKGKDCPFAHDVDELRDKPNLYKTKLCDAFLQDQCTKGDDCSFAHGEGELRSTPDLFKTAICNLWTQGKCNAGDTCRFAHGYDDLRPAPSHQKFHKKKSTNNKSKRNSGFNNNTTQPAYYNSPYPYAPNMYGYPMYPMQMMTGDMQGAYMMNQPYGYGGPMNHPMYKH